MAVRRFFAKRKLHKNRNIWPISAIASKKPIHWKGWPSNKEFCFAISHDIETNIGYGKIHELVELEEKLGFRSVINFIPEGNYTVDKTLIDELKQRGFEVGVHGLHHDGKLYNHFQTFSNRAKRINAYLESWGAAGFRSPLMHRNLDWIHALNIQYDSSTFDTDPFEPQPDGVNTIFPFFVPYKENHSPAKSTNNNENDIAAQQLKHGSRNSRSGYVELPYTLPQDSTLFLLLREKKIEIWKRKLDWIAENKGMAFVNVHPDYMSFNGAQSSSVYPATLYEEFLNYVKTNFDGKYWHALPNQIASHFTSFKSVPDSTT